MFTSFRISFRISLLHLIVFMKHACLLAGLRALIERHLNKCIGKTSKQMYRQKQNPRSIVYTEYLQTTHVQPRYILSLSYVSPMRFGVLFATKKKSVRAAVPSKDNTRKKTSTPNIYCPIEITLVGVVINIVAIDCTVAPVTYVISAELPTGSFASSLCTLRRSTAIFSMHPAPFNCDLLYAPCAVQLRSSLCTLRRSTAIACR
jgi:hypothetical protein